jgi:hypothetical protein
MGKSTISMAIFYSYVSLPEGNKPRLTSVTISKGTILPFAWREVAKPLQAPFLGHQDAGRLWIQAPLRFSFVGNPTDASQYERIQNANGTPGFFCLHLHTVSVWTRKKVTQIPHQPVRLPSAPLDLFPLAAPVETSMARELLGQSDESGCEQMWSSMGSDFRIFRACSPPCEHFRIFPLCSL